MRYYFVTTNKYKVQQYSRIFAGEKIEIEHLHYEMDEIQTLDENVIIRDKATKAYAKVRGDVIVEHASLSLDALNGLPRGFSKPFWEKLSDNICEIAKQMGNRTAKMTVTLAYCDGKRIYPVSVTRDGKLSTKPQGGDFHLDSVFIPRGEKDCLSRMKSDLRDSTSPRLESVQKLCGVLKSLKK